MCVREGERDREEDGDENDSVCFQLENTLVPVFAHRNTFTHTHTHTYTHTHIHIHTNT